MATFISQQLQSEDVAPQHQRREFISGFSGSRGITAAFYKLKNTFVLIVPNVCAT